MAIRTNPSYATAHENLGDIYAKLASQAYNKALQLDATNANSVKPKLALIRDLFSADSQQIRPPCGGSPSTRRRGGHAAPAPRLRQQPPAARSPHPGPGSCGSPCSRLPHRQLRRPPRHRRPLPPPASDAHRTRQAVTAAVQAWAAAWAAKDMKAYLGAYDKSFDPPGRQTRAAWEKEREARIVGKSKISVKLSDINVSVKGDKATARFRQAYSADALNVSSRKTLDLVHNNGRWTIVRESTGG
jgi:ketosteroid isomerase-like protein